MMFEGRVHPQVAFKDTVIDNDSFFGGFRKLFSETVLKAQLEQMQKSGVWDAFTLKWQPYYDIKPLHGAVPRPDGGPPNLFQECDISTWTEAGCYFLATREGQNSPHRAEFEACVEEQVDRISKAIQPDGYLGIYFHVVDPEGRLMNLRDMHEMYECGHLTEAALAHYHLTGSRKFLDVMIQSVQFFMDRFGPKPDQLHGYPGHPELELAVLRLYEVTKDPRHLAFARYLLEERGQKREDQHGMSYFDWEAMYRRKNLAHKHNLGAWNDQAYTQAHLPLHEQMTILGHSVRALYLLTAAADIGGEFLEDAKRLFLDAVEKKMYITGGVGSEPQSEGFSAYPYRFPQSAAEGGGYNETCASIAMMMVAERILSHGLDGEIRDVLERCLFNNVLGGGSLDGKAFSYENQLATCADRTIIRKSWFDTACCPPNLARTMGMLGGYLWNTGVSDKCIDVSVYLYVSATRTIQLPDGVATIRMTTEMPWKGGATWEVSAPAGWTWRLRVPAPAYAEGISVSAPHESRNGFITVRLDKNGTVRQDFTFDVRLVAPHPRTGQDTLAVTRGPIVYTVESADNLVEKEYPHFEGIGLSSGANFSEQEREINGFRFLQLTTSDVFALEGINDPAPFRDVSRKWVKLGKELHFVPWYARGNSGGAGHIRTMLQRAE